MVVAEPTELTEAEFRRAVDGRTRATFGLSVDEFVRALQEGELDPELPEVAGLAILVGARPR